MSLPVCYKENLGMDFYWHDNDDASCGASQLTRQVGMDRRRDPRLFLREPIGLI